MTDSSSTPDYLASVRRFMTEQNLSVFLLPRTDEYLNEYVPDYLNRIALLTGFTGSAGLAVITQNQATLFTDGRYTAQAARECPHYTIINSGDIKLHDFIAQHGGSNPRIGYDARLHTQKWVETIQAEWPDDWHIIPLAINPLDGFIDTIKKPALAPPFIHPLECAGATTTEKIALLLPALQAKKIDSFILTDLCDIAWLLNLRGNDLPHTPVFLCRAILQGDGTLIVFIDSHRISADSQNHVGPAVSFQPPEHLAPWLAGQTGRVGYDPAATPAWFFNALHAAKRIAMTNPCQLAKACKNPVELAGIRAAHHRDAQAVYKTVQWIETNATYHQPLDELQVVSFLREQREQQNLFVDDSFPTIAGFGANGAIIHYRPQADTNLSFTGNNLFLLDSGGQYWDGTTDITRTLAIGTPRAEHRLHYTLVLKGHIALATARFPVGTTGAQLDAFARQFLWQQGLDFDHGTGHGVGCFLSVHEGPQRISKRDDGVALQPGMIVSNEPGYYKNGDYGIRLENLMAVVSLPPPPAGQKQFLAFETLTFVPFDTRLIDTDMLTTSERSWLGRYHEQCRLVQE